MCGILGLITSRGRRLSIDRPTITRLRDRMTHRGPDGEGLWLDDEHSAAIGHRRLAILDPARGQQPVEWPGVRPDHADALVLTYNGELYNHRELRLELEARGHRFTTDCDAETVLHAVAEWGVGAACRRFRGMYAFGVYEPARRRLTLARDPLGIKPLHYAMVDTPGDGAECVFASEPLAILDHPHMAVQPDWVTVSAYLSTIRTTLGSRSMFNGVQVVQPGEIITIDADDGRPAIIDVDRLTVDPVDTSDDLDTLIERTRATITDSVNAHLLSDVPVCCLLSGGLDSTITTAIARRKIDELRTYCAGTPGGSAAEDDLAFAQIASDRLRTRHHNVHVTDEGFHQLWPGMIGSLGVPLSTPNEVAIYALASVISRDSKVTISGEGADELFGGYGDVLENAAAYVANPVGPDGRPLAPEAFYLSCVSWIPLGHKANLLTPAIQAASMNDIELVHSVSEAFARNGGTDAGLTAHMGLHREFNLTGLLGRLDTATMLASVEGRTPFADIDVARFAGGLPTSTLFDTGDAPLMNDGGVTTAAVASPVTTKRLLRQAFASEVPPDIMWRPKASFPLPFREWLDPHLPVLRRSASAAQVFTPEAIERVSAGPGETTWQEAWPMVNIAHWLAAIWD